MTYRTKDPFKKKTSNPFFDTAEQFKLFDDFPKLKLKRIVQKQKPIDLAGPFNEEYPSDFVFTTASGMCISTYPMDVVRNVRDAEPNCDSYRIKAFENATIFAVCDGCGWGVSSKEASNCAKDTFVNYLAQKAVKSLRTLREVGDHLLNALNSAHQAIVASQNDDSIIAGTTAILGGMILEVDIKASLEKEKDGLLSPQLSSRHTRSSSTTTPSLVGSQTTIPPWVFVGISVGDCKAFHFSVRKKVVTDITVGNRGEKNDIGDPGGRIGPFRNDEPDLRNLRALYWPCEEGDLILVTTDGVHDNLDPEVIGRTVKELKTLPFPHISPPLIASDSTSQSNVVSATATTESDEPPTQMIDLNQKNTNKESQNKERKSRKTHTDKIVSEDKSQTLQKSDSSENTSSSQNPTKTPSNNPNIKSDSKIEANNRDSESQENIHSKGENKPSVKNESRTNETNLNGLHSPRQSEVITELWDMQGSILIASPHLSTTTRRGKSPLLPSDDPIPSNIADQNMTESTDRNETKQPTKMTPTSPRRVIDNEDQHNQNREKSTTSRETNPLEREKNQQSPNSKNKTKTTKEKSPRTKEDLFEPKSTPLKIEATFERKPLQSPKKSFPLLKTAAEAPNSDDPLTMKNQTESKEETWETLPGPQKAKLKEKFMAELLASLIGTDTSPVAVTKRIIHHCLKVTSKSREWMEQNPHSRLEKDWIKYPGKLDHTTCVVIKCTIHDAERDRAQKENMIPSFSSIT